jgi:hypothetical protein
MRQCGHCQLCCKVLPHRDPKFRAYVEHRAREGIWTLIRKNSRDGFALIPPCTAEDGQWYEQAGDLQ